MYLNHTVTVTVKPGLNHTVVAHKIGPSDTHCSVDLLSWVFHIFSQKLSTVGSLSLLCTWAEAGAGVASLSPGRVSKQGAEQGEIHVKSLTPLRGSTWIFSWSLVKFQNLGLGQCGPGLASALVTLRDLSREGWNIPFLKAAQSIKGYQWSLPNCLVPAVSGSRPELLITHGFTSIVLFGVDSLWSSVCVCVCVAKGPVFKELIT